jgi:hypothetical protein
LYLFTIIKNRQSYDGFLFFWALHAPAAAGSVPVFRSQSVIARDEAIYNEIALSLAITGFPLNT